MRDIKSLLLVVLAVLCLAGAMACERRPRTYAGTEQPKPTETINPHKQY